MPLLGGLLVTLFSGLAALLVEMFAKKVAIALAFVASLTIVVVAVLGLLTFVVAPIASAIFSSYTYLGWMGLAFPQPATGACITALSAVWSGTVLYAWQREALRIAASA